MGQCEHSTFPSRNTVSPGWISSGRRHDLVNLLSRCASNKAIVSQFQTHPSQTWPLDAGAEALQTTCLLCRWLPVRFCQQAVRGGVLLEWREKKGLPASYSLPVPSSTVPPSAASSTRTHRTGPSQGLRNTSTCWSPPVLRGLSYSVVTFSTSFLYSSHMVAAPAFSTSIIPLFVFLVTQITTLYPLNNYLY